MTANLISTAYDALFHVLGIPLKNCTVIDISGRPGELPKVTLQMVPLPGSITETRQLFELRPIGQPEAEPLDLEAMAADAAARVVRQIDKSADEARAAISKAFKRANRRLLKTWSFDRLEDTDVERHLVGLPHPVYVEGGAA